MSDIKRFISDQPLETSFYVEDYVELVSECYLTLLEEKGFTWGNEIPHVSDDEFWDIFKFFEKEEE